MQSKCVILKNKDILKKLNEIDVRNVNDLLILQYKQTKIRVRYISQGFIQKTKSFKSIEQKRNIKDRRT